MKLNFDEVRKDRIKTYYTLRLNLGVSRTNQEFGLSGNFLYVLKEIRLANGLIYDTTIIFNELNNDPVPLKQGRKIVTPFYRFFISNSNMGTNYFIDLIFGPSALDFDIFDAYNSFIAERTQSASIANIVCTVAGTEYSQQISYTANRLFIRARGGIIKFCFDSGQSGTTYFSLNDGQFISFEDFKLAYILYLQSPTAGAVCEVIQFLE